MNLRRIFIKLSVCLGRAIDIWSKNAYPANVLSNLCDNNFEFEGIGCASMEGFLQSLKYKDFALQRQICGITGKEAKKITTSVWQENQIVWWKGQVVNRQSEDFISLIRNAYLAMFSQNNEFRKALLATKGKRLYHSKGGKNPYKTILTEKEFCRILTVIRDNNDECN